MILALFVLWVLAEIAAMIAVAHAVGALVTVLALIAGWPVGWWLMRAEGRATLRRVQEAFAAGRAVDGSGSVIQGALALAAGPLFIVPGFITDALALVLLVPFVRRRAAALVLRHARGRVVRRAAGFAGGARRDYDVDSTASPVPRTGHDLDPPRLPG